MPQNSSGHSRVQRALLSVSDKTFLVDFAQKEKIALTVVGPELPLSQGIVNEFNQQGLRIFGPSKEATEIESSKVFSKYLLKKYNRITSRITIIPSQNAKFIIKAVISTVQRFTAPIIVLIVLSRM